MRDWTLAGEWVADRGFSCAENRRELRRGGGHYIIGKKLRSGSAEATAALSSRAWRISAESSGCSPASTTPAPGSRPS